MYVWIFHNKKGKRKTYGGFEHMNFQPRRGPGEVGRRCEEQLGDGQKESALFLDILGQPCCLLRHCSFLRDSLWSSLSFVPLDSAILVIADWPREGVLNKGILLYSKVSQPGAMDILYWIIFLYGALFCILRMFSSIPDLYPLDASSTASSLQPPPHCDNQMFLGGKIAPNCEPLKYRDVNF